MVGGDTQSSTPEQIGFRKDYSCADNFTVFKLDIEKPFKMREHVWAVYLDIGNAFNNVCCDILIDKLARIGCSGKVLRLVKFLIYEKNIYTKINLNEPRRS